MPRRKSGVPNISQSRKEISSCKMFWLGRMANKNLTLAPSILSTHSFLLENRLLPAFEIDNRKVSWTLNAFWWRVNGRRTKLKEKESTSGLQKDLHNSCQQARIHLIQCQFSVRFSRGGLDQNEEQRNNAPQADSAWVSDKWRKL